MNLENLKKISADYEISEDILILIFEKSFDLTLNEIYDTNARYILDIENKKVKAYKGDKVTEYTLIECLKTKDFLFFQRLFLKDLLNKVNPNKFPKKINIQKEIEKHKILEQEMNNLLREDFNYESGPYCSACQESPCMCSDREQTSTVFDF